MSALPLKADTSAAQTNLRFGPKADIRRLSNGPISIRWPTELPTHQSVSTEQVRPKCRCSQRGGRKRAQAPEESSPSNRDRYIDSECAHNASRSKCTQSPSKEGQWAKPGCGMKSLRKWSKKLRALVTTTRESLYQCCEPISAVGWNAKIVFKEALHATTLLDSNSTLAKRPI